MGILYDRDYYDDKTLTLTEPLTHARIGYENFVTETNVVASGALAGFEESALGNSFTFEIWKPPTLPADVDIDLGEARTIDYLGLAVNGLSNCEIRLSYSADGLTYTEARSAILPENRSTMLLFEPVTARYWRLSVIGWAETATLSADFTTQTYLLGDYTDAGGAYLGVLYLGQALQMQRAMYQGHTATNQAARNEIRPTRSEGGQWLGRSVVRRGYNGDYSWSNLTALWYRDNFQPFVEAAVTGPFFVAWRPETFADEVEFGWTEQDISPNNTGPRDLMSVSFTTTAHGDQ